MLVDENIRSNKAWVAINFPALPRTVLAYPQYILRIANHGGAHDGGPALVPATTPPRLRTSQIACSIGVGLQLVSSSASVMRSCAPPEKKMPVLVWTLAINAD